MNYLLVLALVALTLPAIFFVDWICQWAMRLALSETGRRPETAADLEGAASAAESKTEAKPDLEHAQAA